MPVREEHHHQSSRKLTATGDLEEQDGEEVLCKDAEAGTDTSELAGIADASGNNPFSVMQEPQLMWLEAWTEKEGGRDCPSLHLQT